MSSRGLSLAYWDCAQAKLEAEIEALGARKRPTKVDQHSNLGADVPIKDLVHV